jgi:hypothetical protein
VPEHFDIFSTKYIEEELQNAKENKLNPIIINAMEIGYASKKFYDTPEVRSVLTLTLMLDPFSNLTDEEKSLRLANKGITELDYIISSNIYSFVTRAISEDEHFEAKELAEQREVLVKYAEEVQETNSAAAEVLGEEEGGEVGEENPDGEQEPLTEENGNNTGTNPEANANGG